MSSSFSDVFSVDWSADPDSSLPEDPEPSPAFRSASICAAAYAIAPAPMAPAVVPFFTASSIVASTALSCASEVGGTFR